MSAEKLLECRIDDRTVAVEKGKTILQAAQSLAINIPTLCYHEELAPYGACRVCLVEITKAGKPALVTACSYPVEDGLVVRTGTERVTKARQFVLELLLTQAPNAPQIKRLASKYGVTKSRFQRFEDDPRECVLCGLCVRVCSEQVKANVLDFAFRGAKCRVTTAFERPFAEVCTTCGKCVQVCPVEPE